MNYIKIFLSTVFIFTTLFTASAQDITLRTQAEVDAFDKSITTIKGNLKIGHYYGTDIKNLDGLSQVTTVGGYLYIKKIVLLRIWTDCLKLRQLAGI